MYYMGIDIGSLSCDAVIIDNNNDIIASSVVPTGAQNIEAIRRVKEDVFKIANIESNDIISIVSTGYGRNRVSERNTAVTEITCHAKGISSIFPETNILVDIGGQDSKAVKINKNGKVVDFAMNDKCAAGTGRFLEAMARALQVDINELSDLDLGASGNITISSMCTVFAESEVVSLIANGTEINEIVNGLNRSISSRTISLIKRICSDLTDINISMSGGVARNNGVVRALEKIIGKNIFVPENPDTIGAYGAALIAKEKYPEK